MVFRFVNWSLRQMMISLLKQARRWFVLRKWFLSKPKNPLKINQPQNLCLVKTEARSKPISNTYLKLDLVMSMEVLRMARLSSYHGKDRFNKFHIPQTPLTRFYTAIKMKFTNKKHSVEFVTSKTKFISKLLTIQFLSSIPIPLKLTWTKPKLLQSL